MTQSPPPETGPKAAAPSSPRERLQLAQASLGMPVLPPRNAFIELGVFVLVVVAMHRLVPQFDVNAIQPNPCWLPVLLLSLQYGTVSGLFAAAAAIAITVMGGFPEQDIGENHFAYLLRIWGQPILWIAAALVLGQFRMRQIEAKLELRRQVATLSTERAAVAEYATNLRQRCEVLERQISSRLEQRDGNLMHALGRARRAGADDLAAGLEQVFAVACPNARAALYRLDGNALRLRLEVGPSGTTAARPLIGSDDALFRAVVGDSETVSVLTPEGEAKLATEGLAAAPVISAEGRVVGMLRIDSIAADALSPETVAALPLVAAAFAPALSGGFERAPPGGVESRSDREVRRSTIWRPIRGKAEKRDAPADAERPPPEPTRAVR